MDRKTALWNDCGKNSEGIRIWCCSECGHLASDYFDEECPNCKAVMINSSTYLVRKRYEI